MLAVRLVIMLGVLSAAGRLSSAAVEVKPRAIALNAPPQVDTPQSCIIRAGGGTAVGIESVVSSDPAIRAGKGDITDLTF